MYQEIPTESQAFTMLETLELSPMVLTVKETGAHSSDVVCDAIWDDETATFAIEYKRLGTPKEFARLLLQLQAWNLPNGTFPMLLLPYLKPEQLEELSQLKLSGIDLCGNGVITIPGRLKVYRTGQPNRFKSTASIKNIYRGKTSLVARMFASKNSFDSVQMLRDEIVKRDQLVASGLTKPIGLSTVSKALKTLEQDLIISREGNSGAAIELLQRDRLLDLLMKNDRPLERPRQVKLKIDSTDENLNDWISKRLRALEVSVAATGLTSTSRYAMMQRGSVIKMYATSIPKIVEAFVVGGNAKEVDHFENVVLVESKRAIDYFDVRANNSFPWASPLQTWLELMRGDKRDRETARQLREALLASGSNE